MKKFLLLVILMLSFSVVHAEEVNIGVLYPVNSSYNVVTDNFNYDNFYYNTTLDTTSRQTITIGSVRNNYNKSLPVSIRVGLFDKDKKNIGVVNYCSTHDTESDYSYKKLMPNETTGFYIKVSEKKHISKNKKLADVAYVAVLDDNKICSTDGMQNKYTNLTIEQINKGEVSVKIEKFFDLDFIKKLQNISISTATITLLVGLGVLLLVYIIVGKILNALHNKMYNKKTALAYIPIANLYITVKLAFGPAIGKIYLIVYLISIPLGIISSMIPSTVSLISTVAFLLDIVKLITKKYSLLYIDNLNFSKKIDEQVNNINNNTTNVNKNDNSIYDINKDSSKNDLLDNDNNDLLSNLGVDLNDNNKNDEDVEVGGQFFNISPGNPNSSDNSNDNDNSKDNGSDLTDLFR